MFSALKYSFLHYESCVSSLVDYSFLLHFNKKMKFKKGKYPNGIEIFTFSVWANELFVWSAVCIDFKKIWQMVIIWSENMLKVNLMYSWWLKEFRWVKVSRLWTLDEFQYKHGFTLSWRMSLFYIEASPLIFSASQWTGFYVIRTTVMKELNNQLLNFAHEVLAGYWTKAYPRFFWQ